MQRGELEETFVTNTKPLEASKIKIRGAGEKLLSKYVCCVVLHGGCSSNKMHKHI